MRLPNKKLVERLQKRVSGSFFVDTATITYRTISYYNEYGQAIYAPLYGEVLYGEALYNGLITNTVDCSFSDKPSPEVWAGYADIESVQAEIRFVGTKPSKGDLVTLSHRFDRDDSDSQDFTAVADFEIVGIKDRDVFGYVCALKKVAI